MNDYLITWTIDIYADTSEEAAIKALEIQRDPSSIATYFHVKNKDTGEFLGIDLEDSKND